MIKYNLSSSPIIIPTMKVLVWHLLIYFMVGGVDPQLIGLKWVSLLFLAPI